MKKFSTAALILALVATTASSALAADKKKCALRPNAPDKHVVVKGDTLWGIANTFLESPWCWPDVWGMNSEQIRNPHWIFPGQVVYVDRTTGQLRLGSPKSGDTAKVPYVATAPAPAGEARLKPTSRITPIDKDALPSIEPKIIEPFLSQALVVEGDELDDAPYIVGTMDARVKLGKDDRAYARGNLKGHGLFNVFRPAQALKDPVTKKVLAYEAVHVGIVKLVRPSTDPNVAHGFDVIEASREMEAGDRLVLRPPHTIVNYVPHPPDKPIDAHIVSIYGGGVTHSGQNQIVTINRGLNDGLEVGTVLKIYRLGDVVQDRTGGFFGGSHIKLPDEESGTLFVFRVFKNISYALTMEAKNVVVVGDTVRSPE